MDLTFDNFLTLGLVASSAIMSFMATLEALKYFDFRATIQLYLSKWYDDNGYYSENLPEVDGLLLENMYRSRKRASLYVCILVSIILAGLL